MIPALWGIGTLLLAVIIHIAAVLMVPRLSTDTAWQMLYSELTENSARVLPAAGTADVPLDLMDPQMIVALCRYDLANGPLRLTVPPVQTYWSLAFVTRNKTTIYSINDRTASNTGQGIFAVAKQDAPRFYANLPDSDSLPLVVEAEAPEGVAVLRILADAPSQVAYYRGLASEYGCGTEG